MSSSIVHLASPESNGTNHEDGNDSGFRTLDPTAPTFILPAETLLQAAVSLKDQVT